MDFLSEICKNADVIVAAIGKAKFVTKDMVKKGAIVIDVGINRLENGKLCGMVSLGDMAVSEDCVMDAADALTDIASNISRR